MNITEHQFENLDDVPFELVRAMQPELVYIRNGQVWVICGTAYGWLHDLRGGIREFGSRDAAEKEVRRRRIIESHCS